VDKLEGVGFKQLSKREKFKGKLEAGGLYYYTINKSALVAFAVGKNYVPGNGFKIIGGHTDSPNLKVKPCSKRTGSGVKQLAVECYGGGLWHTWFDRDLGISGRVLVRSDNGNVVQKLVKIDKPVARVSTLCIHLQSAEERVAFKVNKEDHLSPIVASALEKEAESQLSETNQWLNTQDPMLMTLLAEKLCVKIDDIVSFELNLFDAQKPQVGGIANEFLYSGRLDNLATCFVALESMVDHSVNNLENDTDISMIVLFDHEEVGSTSLPGAGAPTVSEAVRRISSAFDAEADSDTYAAAIRKSFILSVDQAHAIHPNYAHKHEKGHQPKMNAGIVIKNNANQRYATNSISAFVVRELGMKADIPVQVQEFVVRNDCPCGSTIGPRLSTNTGIRTVDIGMPQLSMHSCREVMGVADLSNGLGIFNSFFKNFREIDDNLEG